MYQGEFDEIGPILPGCTIAVPINHVSWDYFTARPCVVDEYATDDHKHDEDDHELPVRSTYGEKKNKK